ncbi:MAG: cupredoxin domain-containing protein [Acidobacteriaceae bacterium]
MQYPAKRFHFFILLLAVSFVFSVGCKRAPQRQVTFRQKIEMEQYDIWPDVIHIPRGSYVELTVTSNDVEHGLAIDGLGINEPVHPGRTTVIYFLADKPGTYRMRCSIRCGRGHNKMLGQVIIQ